MKDKEKQIEEMRIQRKIEMTKDISNGIRGVLAYEIQKLAEHLISLNYVKLPEDSVVLSKEEYDTLRAENDKYVKDCIDYLATINKLENKVWEVEQQSSKETAEKILDFIQENRHKYEMWYLVSELRKFFGIEQNNDWVFGDLADELNNKFGVEIKE